MGEITKPPYFGKYNPGDIVPLSLFLKACNNCFGPAGNPGFSSDAAFFRLKPEPKEWAAHERQQKVESLASFRKEVKRLEAELEKNE